MTLASPRQIIGAYAPKQTSYFGLPSQVGANYETDPSKLADTTTLGGSLSGLWKGGVNAVANAAGRAYNAVAATGTPTTTMEQRNAAFPAQNLQRYATPTGGVRQAPRVPPVAQQPSDTSWEAAPQQPASYALASSNVSAPSPSGGIRRAARSQAPASMSVPMPTPTVTWDEQNQPDDPGTADQGYIEQGGIKMYVPGSKSYDTPGVSTLSGPAFDAPATPAAPQLTTVGTGSGVYQLAPGQNLPVDGDTSFGGLMAARANSALGLRQAQTNYYGAEGAHLGTQDTIGMTKLAPEIQGLNAETSYKGMLTSTGFPKAAAEVNLNNAQAGRAQQETSNLALTGQTIIPLAQSEIGVRGATARSLNTNADATTAKLPAEIGNLSADAQYKQAMAAGVPSKSDALLATAAARQQATQETEMKTFAAADPDFAAKMGVVGGSLDAYKRAEQLAAAQGASFKSKPFKSGIPGFRTTNPAGYYTANGKALPMAALTTKAPIATATDSAGQKWVKYSDGTTAKAQ